MNQFPKKSSKRMLALLFSALLLAGCGAEPDASSSSREDSETASSAQTESSSSPHSEETTPEESSEAESSTEAVSLPVGKVEEEPPAGDAFVFAVSDGGATLVSYTGNEKAVTVPSVYLGVPVTAIGDSAFEGNTRLQSVELPSSLETIGWFAFSGCVALSEVTVPASVGSVSYGAFQYCSKDLTLICPADSYAHRYAVSFGIRTSP